uniref:Uncharacterized protein n=1 Tax=Anguilla anguilla TaxID=7936 RepID=A0A0E9VCP8_ANGAN
MPAKGGRVAYPSKRSKSTREWRRWCGSSTL